MRPKGHLGVQAWGMTQRHETVALPLGDHSRKVEAWSDGIASIPAPLDHKHRPPKHEGGGRGLPCLPTCSSTAHWTTGGRRESADHLRRQREPLSRNPVRKTRPWSEYSQGCQKQRIKLSRFLRKEPPAASKLRHHPGQCSATTRSSYPPPPRQCNCKPSTSGWLPDMQRSGVQEKRGPKASPCHALLSGPLQPGFGDKLDLAPILGRHGMGTRDRGQCFGKMPIMRLLQISKQCRQRNRTQVDDFLVGRMAAPLRTVR